MQFDDVKTTIKEHPVETVAIVAGVSILGYFFYQRKQDKLRKHELELARLRSITPIKVRRGFRRRQYVLNLAA